MSKESKTPSNTPKHVIGRWVLLSMILGADVLYRVLYATSIPRPACESIRLVAGLGVYAAAIVMAYMTARQFEPTVITRRIWLVLMLEGVSGFLVDIGGYLPVITGMYPGARLILLASYISITIVSMLLSWALFMMVKVYRRTGMPLRLRTLHYVAMVVVAATGTMQVWFILHAQFLLSSPDLLRSIRIIVLPIPLFFVLTAVFGMMIWQYAMQMGGGLVAKAWRTVLLVTVTQLLGNTLGGWIDAIGPAVIIRILVGETGYLGYALAGYLLYLGASYQYQACTESEPLDIDESKLESLTAA